MARLDALLRRMPVWVAYGLAAVPGLWLLGQAIAADLGPDPVKVIEHRLGELALQLILAGLCVTPLRRLGLNLLRYRRAIGLMAFAYAVLHVLAWATLDMALRWDEMAADLWKRPHILAGAVAILVLIPLAVTSTDRWIRRMGGPAWRRLHRLVHVAAVAAVIHLLLLLKVPTAESLVYAGLLALLLGFRLVRVLPRAGMARER